MMRAFTAFTCFLGLYGSVISQPLGEAYWVRIRERADSVVISRFGSDFFKHHVFTPAEALEYVVVGDGSIDREHRDTITREPSLCRFEYNIGFDALHAGWMNISFSITPDGRLIEDEDLRGFVEHGPPFAFHTDLCGFIELARANGVRCARRSAFREIRWIPLDTTARVHPGGNGRYELVLGRIRGKKREKVSSSTHTYQVVDAIVLDPFTGAVLRKEERHETLGWTCGPEFL